MGCELYSVGSDQITYAIDKISIAVNMFSYPAISCTVASKSKKVDDWIVKAMYHFNDEKIYWGIRSTKPAKDYALDMTLVIISAKFNKGNGFDLELREKTSVKLHTTYKTVVEDVSPRMHYHEDYYFPFSDVIDAICDKKVAVEKNDLEKQNKKTQPYFIRYYKPKNLSAFQAISLLARRYGYAIVYNRDNYIMRDILVNLGLCDFTGFDTELANYYSNAKTALDIKIDYLPMIKAFMVTDAMSFSRDMPTFKDSYSDEVDGKGKRKNFSVNRLSNSDASCTEKGKEAESIYSIYSGMLGSNYQVFEDSCTSCKGAPNAAFRKLLSDLNMRFMDARQSTLAFSGTSESDEFFKFFKLFHEYIGAYSYFLTTCNSGALDKLTNKQDKDKKVSDKESDNVFNLRVRAAKTISGVYGSTFPFPVKSGGEILTNIYASWSRSTGFMGQFTLPCCLATSDTKGKMTPGQRFKQLVEGQRYEVEFKELT